MRPGLKCSWEQCLCYRTEYIVIVCSYAQTPYEGVWGLQQKSIL